MSKTNAIHASAVLVGENGVLIRGPSGYGKSALAAELADRAKRAKLFASLVGDDRILLRRVNQRLLMAPHRAVEGLMEHRFVGLKTTRYESRAIVRLIVDLVEAGATPLERMPDPDASARLLGVDLPVLVFPVNYAPAPRLIFTRLAEGYGTWAKGL